MSYRISAFGAVALPDAMLQDDLSTARVPSGLIDTLGATVDAYGTRQRLPTRQELAISGLYAGELNTLVTHAGDTLVTHAGDTLIAGTAANNLRSQVETLRAQVGTRQRLYRRRTDDGVRQWRNARLLAVTTKGNVEHWAADVAEVTAIFETAQGRWRSLGQASVAAALAANVPKNMVASGGGNAPIEDAVLSVLASGAISSVRVQAAASGVDWLWTGSLSSGQTLTIDCGALTVRRGSTDVYSGFGFNAGHTAAGWLPLAVGTNVVTITANGPGTATITWYDQWL